MSRKIFTKEQQQLLQQNPYIYSVTDTRITLTKAFKEIFMTAYNTGTSPRTILEDHGFDISIIGERHIWSISNARDPVTVLSKNVLKLPEFIRVGRNGFICCVRLIR